MEADFETRKTYFMNKPAATEHHSSVENLQSEASPKTFNKHYPKHEEDRDILQVCSKNMSNFTPPYSFNSVHNKTLRSTMTLVAKETRWNADRS